MDSKNSEITESENTSKNGSLFDELFKGAPSWSVLLEYFVHPDRVLRGEKKLCL